MFEFIAYTICSVSFLILGLVALLGNPKARHAQAFFGFAMIAILWLVTLFFGYYFEGNRELSLFFIRFTNGVPMLGMMFLAIFFYEFPYRTYHIDKRIRISFIIFVCLSSFVVSFTNLAQIDVLVEGGEIVWEKLGWVFNVFALEALALIILIMGLGIKKIKTLEGIDESKTKIALGGFLVFAVLILSTNTILPILGTNMFVKVSVLFSIFFIAPTFYAIQKHRFFNLSYITLNILRMFIFFGTFVIILLLFDTLFLRFIFGLPEIIKLMIVGGTSLSIIMYLEKKLPKFYSRSLRQLHDAMNKLQSKISYYDDYNNLIHCIEDVFVRDLHIDNVKVFVVRDKKAKINIPIYTRDQFTKELEKYGNDVVFAEDLQYTKISEVRKGILKKGLSSLEAKVCIKLFVEKNLIGFFTFGAKGSKASYSLEEIEEILKIKQNLEIFLMNFMLSQNLKEENNLMKLIIDKKTKKLKTQFKQIKELLGHQSDFLAMTAHEFRTPLSIALFQLEDMFYEHKHENPVVQDLKIMESSLKNLKNLMQKFFDVQQYNLDKVKLVKTRINIYEYLENVYADFIPVMKNKNVKFSFENNLKKRTSIQIDPSMIRQVLTNLLDNAAKFAKKIKLEVKENDNKILIRIIDNGPGVPDKDKEKIFGKFEDLEFSRGMGIGLGLYICRKIIELHKGEIFVQDTEGGGATMIVELNK